MGRRRKGRELALSLLYQLDVQGETSPEPHFVEFWSRHPVEADVREFAETLVRGTMLHRAKIDEIIAQYALHWELERMAVVDRNLLRMAVYEFLYQPNTPKTVAINEALEIARRFSTQEATQFINGILDAIKRDLETQAAPPQPTTTAVSTK